MMLARCQVSLVPLALLLIGLLHTVPAYGDSNQPEKDSCCGIDDAYSSLKEKKTLGKIAFVVAAGFAATYISWSWIAIKLLEVLHAIMYGFFYLVRFGGMDARRMYRMQTAGPATMPLSTADDSTTEGTIWSHAWLLLTVPLLVVVLFTVVMCYYRGPANKMKAAKSVAVKLFKWICLCDCEEQSKGSQGEPGQEELSNVAINMEPTEAIENEPSVLDDASLAPPPNKKKRTKKRVKAASAKLVVDAFEPEPEEVTAEVKKKTTKKKKKSKGQSR